MNPMSRLAIALAGLCLVTGPVRAQDFDAAGFRDARYRAPVNVDPAPASRIALAEALALDPGHDALFLDVMPVEGGVRDATNGTWRLSSPHETIPGAQWHPEAGRSPVDDVLWGGLRNAVETARRGRPDLPVVVFCREDCWMSWNAARRLATEGVRNVFWLAEGTDGWHAAGRNLVSATPVPISPRRCSKRR